MHPRVESVETWAGRQADVSSSEQARRLGLPRPWPQRLAAAGRWQRVLRGIYWTGSRRPSGPERVTGPGTVALAVAVRLFGGGGLSSLGVVSGRLAARLWDIDTDRAGIRPDLHLPPGLTRRQPHDLRYHWDPLGPPDVALVGGIPCTSVSRTLLDVSSAAPFADLLVWTDAAMRRGLLTRAEVSALATRSRRRAFDAADGRAESPLESRVRAELILAGLPPPELQYEVRHAGRFVARVDFAWPEQRVLLEADGAATHAGPDALARDLRRQNELVRAGWTVVRVTWPDLGGVGSVVRDVLRRAPLRRAS